MKSSLTYDNLEPLHHELLRILKVFITICEKHGLMYYAGYGTALGAVRHRGIIPWDDDLDVIMPREDYNRFLQIVSGELPTGWGLVSEQTEPCYDCSWCKIQNFNRKEIEECECALGDKIPQGLYIDIFPLNAVPDSKFGNLKRDLHYLCALARLRWDVKESCRSKLRSLAGWVIALLVSRWFIPKFSTKGDFYEYVWHKVVTSPKFGECRLVSPRMISRQKWPPFRPFPVEYLGDGEYVEFSGLKIRIPRMWHDYLSFFYGDYMTPPPPESRKCKHSVEAVAAWKFGLTRDCQSDV